MEITPQVIIDKEFRVKFRGFDMAEVDAFLEEVAQNFFKLIEENDRLNEKVAALDERMGSGGETAPQVQVKLPVELKNFLKELKRDTAAINEELGALKQDPSALASLENSLKETVTALQSAAASASDQTEEINAELAGLKEGRESFDLLKKNVEQILSVINESGFAPALQSQTERGDMEKIIAAELTSFKEEVAAIRQFQEDIKIDLQEMLQANFAELEAKLSQAAPALPKKTKRAQAEPLKAAIIEEEPEALQPEGPTLPDFEAAEEDTGDDELEFLSEDDIIDVDKLRGVFQSVLDDSLGDAPSGREDEEETASDLLFFDDDLLEDMNEPEVTISLEKKGN